MKAPKKKTSTIIRTEGLIDYSEILGFRVDSNCTPSGMLGTPPKKKGVALSNEPSKILKNKSV